MHSGIKPGPNYRVLLRLFVSYLIVGRGDLQCLFIGVRNLFPSAAGVRKGELGEEVNRLGVPTHQLTVTQAQFFTSHHLHAIAFSVDA
jgi:hypothetical protein